MSLPLPLKSRDPQPLFWTTKDVAKLMGVSYVTVRRWVREGKLKSRLWAIGGAVRRIVQSSDLVDFIERERPYDGARPESLAQRIMERHRAHGRKAAAARKRKQQAASQNRKPSESPNQ